MKTAAPILRGGILGLVLLGPATGTPAVKDTYGSRAPDITTSDERSLLEYTPRPTLAAPSADPFPGHTYGDLDGASCLQALDDRAIPYERHGRARGVDAPVRLTGALHGVRFIHADLTDWEESARREVMDCRLVLALDDFAALVATRGVTTVVHFGVYRGDLPLPKHGRPLHHVAALAIDVAGFAKDDGARLDVKRDWHGYVGARTCSGVAPGPVDTRIAFEEGATPAARALGLRDLLCATVDEKLFHQVLTPNHDARHRDHFHLEVMRGTSWTMVQ